jgi:hypothetical protein
LDSVLGDLAHLEKIRPCPLKFRDVMFTRHWQVPF